jgi:hypothetical protein
MGSKIKNQQAIKCYNLLILLYFLASPRGHVFYHRCSMNMQLLYNGLIS